MDYGRFAERLMGMNDEAWARHANPWSVWTRVPILPLLVLSVYARAWIGWWALVPVALILVWIAVNPRAFPPPKRLSSWASRGVMGERIWLARKTAPIPAEFVRAAHVLTLVSALGVVLIVYGLVLVSAWPAITGTILALGGKVWFVDRMVWLYDVTEGRPNSG